MQVHFHSTTEDTIRFNRYHYGNTKDGKDRIFKAQFLTILICALGVLYGFRDENIVLIAFCLAFGAISCLMMSRLILHSVAQRIKKSVAKGESPGILGDCTVTIEPDGFRVNYKQGDAFMKWSAVKTIAESATDIFFYFGEREAMFIPNTAFVSKAEHEQFVSLARQYRENSVGLVL